MLIFEMNNPFVSEEMAIEMFNLNARAVERGISAKIITKSSASTRCLITFSGTLGNFLEDAKEILTSSLNSIKPELRRYLIDQNGEPELNLLINSQEFEEIIFFVENEKKEGKSQNDEQKVDPELDFY